MMSLMWLRLYIFSFLLYVVSSEDDFKGFSTSCAVDHYRCYDGECIPMRLRCDSHRDCVEGDDEFECSLYLCQSPEFFRCHNDRCIHSSFLCNGDDDCGDMSDEAECIPPEHEEAECPPGQFRCEDMICIPSDWVCDGKVDCIDESDERPSVCSNHPACKPDEFQCRNKVCIDKNWHCDGTRDCPDGSDEEKCPRRVVSKEDCTLDNRMFMCKDSILCLESFEVCNNHTDCLDHSDEGGNCSDIAMCHDKCTQMGQECFRTPDGPICGCRKGFQRRNGQCKDIDECQNFGQCDQKCENIPGSYSCLCDPGYLLQRDQRSCKAEGGEAMLVYSTTREVRALYLSSQIYWPVVSDQKHVIGVAYDGRHIYWTEVYHEEEAILRAREDGSNVEVIVSAGLGTPEDLAIDWITKNIYFTDSHLQRIGVCTNDGLACTVIHARNLDKPRGITLHPKEALMYWSDWGDNPVIGRSGMDGSSVVDFVNNSLHWPNGIVIDYSNDRLYWVDAKLLNIESIKLDGTDRRQVLQNSVKHPFAIAVFEDSLYWSDWDGKQIEACNKFTGKERRIILREKKNRIYGVHVFHPVIQNNDVENPCRSSPCSDICLLSPRSSNPKGFKCACPEDKMLKNSDDNWCVLSDSQKTLIIASSSTFYQLEHKKLGKQVITEIPLKNVGRIGAVTYDPIRGSVLMSDTVKKEIQSLHLDSLQLSTVVSGDMGRVEGLAFDYFGNNLYFTDSEFSKLDVVSFVSWERKTLLQRLGGDVPTDVAVIPEEGVMFVSLFNPRGSHIDRFSMSGKLESRSHIIENDLFGPYLPLHYSRLLHRVFWADSHTGYIENTDVEGLNRHIFRKLLTSPVSLTSIDYDLFWTNHDSHLLYWADTADGLSGNKIMDLGDTGKDEILKLVAITGKITDVNHPCKISNGNCSHICLVEKQDKVCACPNGMLLRVDGLNCMVVPHCELNQFECHLSSVSGVTKHCIQRTSLCDHHKDCPNGEDEDEFVCKEYTIECPRGKISCHDGSKCIDEEKRCDLVYDCPDHSDEYECDSVFGDQCDEEHMFKCLSGECITSSRRCDFHKDCKDESDEQDCSNATCMPNVQYRCSSGTCIPSSWYCDREPDCPDGSDEPPACADVKQTCRPDQLTCDNGQCLDKIFQCNEIADCDDGSDENNCPEESATVLSAFIPGRHRPRHCDEATEFACYSVPGTCVPLSARCNKTIECPNGEDEVHCDVCEANEFECENGRCIPNDWVCDKMNDCGDNSDEMTTICSESPLRTEKPEDRCDGFLCANKQCIHMANVCDGHDDCEDKSDEGGKCGFSCQNAGCMDICHDTPTGPKCSCHKGYTLMGDAKTCMDIDECASEQYCSQYCENTLGGFQCSCKHPEYALREDRMSCKAKGFEMQFLFAYQNQIRTMWGSHSHLGVVYIDPNYNFKLSGLAADVHRRQIYWTSETNGAVYRVSMDKHDIIQNVSLSHPSKIAVDWITGNLYVIVDGNQITVCNFDVKKCTPLKTIDPTLKIDALAVDPTSRTMFWSERVKRNQPFSKIYKADLSGSGVKVVVNNDLEVVSSIFISSIHNYIYWAESTKQKIERSTYNGTHRQAVFLSPDIPIDLALFEDYAYFLVESNSMIRRHSLESHGNVWRCGLYGAVSWRCELTRISPIHFGIPYHFEIMHESLQPKGSNYCKRMNCSGLCVLGMSGPVCVCPDGTKGGQNITCPETAIGRAAFAEGDTGLPVNNINDKDGGRTNYFQWLLIITICLALPAFIVLLYRYSRKLYNYTSAVYKDRQSNSTNRGRSAVAFNFIDLVNNGHSLTINDDISHAESSFHHTKLNPGEHQYENPVHTELSGSKVANLDQIETDSDKSRYVSLINNTEELIVEDNGSETSSIEYTDVLLDHQKAPLLS